MNKQPEAEQTPGPALRCLRGAAAPRAIVDDIKAVEALPDPARRQLYRVLGPCLGEEVADIDEPIERFCQEFGISGVELARALKACRFLLRHAATINMTAQEFGDDLLALGDTGALKEALSNGFDVAMKIVRDEIMRAALADHGKLLERVDWRVDQVTMSNRGEDLRLPVTVLTLGYREGGRHERITLQLGPDALRTLRVMCDRLL